MSKRNKSHPLPILIWDAADPARVRLATRGAEFVEDCEWVGYAIPIIGLLMVAGFSPDAARPLKREDLFSYMDRLFPLFLKALEGIWGPFNAPSAYDVLRLAATASALEARQREIEWERWKAEPGPIEWMDDSS